MSLSRQSRLTVGGQTTRPPRRAGHLRHLGLRGHDAAAFTLWPSSKLKDASAGDALEISW
jgi:hypothetical protein